MMLSILPPPFPLFIFTNQPLLVHSTSSLIVLQITTPKCLQAKTQVEVGQAVFMEKSKEQETLCVEKCENDLWQPFNPDAGHEEE